MNLATIDILVNNAGIETIIPFLEITDEQWDTRDGCGLARPLALFAGLLPPRGRGSAVRRTS